jgi:dihydroneopterin aldolase
MAKLALEGMEFYAFHGYYEEEQRSGGRYTVDVYIDLPPDASGKSDQLADTVNYEEIYRIAEEVMKVPVSLIEHVAHTILNRVKKELNVAGQVTVRVRKHHPPIKGVVDQAYVEMSR